MRNRTIWNVMKTYNEEGVYYQILPYNVSVIYDILRSRGEGTSTSREKECKCI